MVKIRVSVSQKDIDEARMRAKSTSSGTYATTCPVALGLKRKGFKSAGVFVRIPSEHTQDGTYGYYTHTLLGRDIVLPDKAQEWIESYDEGRDVKPFSFSLEVPFLSLQSVK